MIPANGMEMFLFLFTTLVSTYLLWGAFKNKDVPRILMGVGASVPSFAIGAFNMWLLGGVIFFAGIYLRRYIDGV